jgi:hypothetical protein
LIGLVCPSLMLHIRLIPQRTQSAGKPVSVPT